MNAPAAPTASDAKPFVPARDFDESLRFYQALGWAANWRAGGLAELELAGSRILLQDFYVREWAENWMLYVEAVLAAGDYGAARVQPPKHEAYGALVAYVWDPCGVLLHFAQSTESAESTDLAA